MASKENGKQINYIVDGDGSPVVLIHGIAASLFDWTEIIPELACCGYRAYALDLPGHGESEKPEKPEDYHIENIYRHFSSWVESLGLDSPPILVGHSMGGYLSLLFSLRCPDYVRALILIDPFYSPKQLSPILQVARYRPTLGVKAMRIIPEWLIHTIMGWDPVSAIHFPTEARQQIAADYKRASPNFVYLTKEISDLTPDIPAIHLPVQLIWGEQDRTLKPQTFTELAELIPNAKTKIIPNCGHQPHIGKPKEVARLTLEFMASLPAIEASPASP